MDEEKSKEKTLKIQTSLLNKVIKETIGDDAIISSKFREKLSLSLLTFCYYLLDT